MSIKFNIINKTIGDIEKASGDKIMEAARYVRKKIVEREKLLFKKRTGDLIKGTVAERMVGANGVYAIVGMAAPAHHAHLLEFGTVPRIVKNYRGKKGVIKAVGQVKPTPFVLPTFDEESGNVEKILNSDWGIN
jgi:hypothetical protein